MNFSIFLFTICILYNLSLFAINKDSPDRKTAYLGIYATKVNPNVSHQLKLPENLYLNVEWVEKNSPAEEAGIQKFDLLLQFNDQILVNQEQLKYLVRSKMPRDEVTLSLLRQGKKQKITLELGETKLTQEDPLRNSGLGNPFPQYDPFDKDFFLHNSQNLQDLIPPLFFNHNRGRHKKTLPPTQLDDEPLHRQSKIESFSRHSSENQVIIKDEDGTLEWTEKDGLKSLLAIDLKGKVIFNGPINSEEQRKALSKNLKIRLKKLESNFSSH